MLNGLRFPWMGTLLIFLKPYLPNLLFTGPGRGLALCLAIDCLYSLNGGWPGFALRKWDQEVLRVWPLGVLLSMEYGLVSLAVYNYFLTRVSFGGKRGNFLTRVSFWGRTGEFLWILSPEYLFGGERGKSILLLIFIFILVISDQTLQNF